MLSCFGDITHRHGGKGAWRSSDAKAENFKNCGRTVLGCRANSCCDERRDGRHFTLAARICCIKTEILPPRYLLKRAWSGETGAKDTLRRLGFGPSQASATHSSSWAPRGTFRSLRSIPAQGKSNRFCANDRYKATAEFRWGAACITVCFLRKAYKQKQSRVGFSALKRFLRTK